MNNAISLFPVLAVVLFAPFLIKKVEQGLEVFLFLMGCIALTVTSQWSMALVREGFIEPVKITLAVLLAGLLFRKLQRTIAHYVNRLVDTLGLKVSAFLLIVALGFLSSVLTAIIAALVLVEIISCLTLDRKHEVQLVVLACFSIGLGAALTPLGEPLSTIVISKLRGDPYQAGFFFLWKELCRFIVPGILGFGLLGSLIVPDERQGSHGLRDEKPENNADILFRAGKVYLFVMGLVFLGRGFKPVIDTYVVKIPFQGLYWLNSISAILDNATLAAAEIAPSMALVQIKSALLGLLIAGGMLIPGNIPNIISAGKLKIKSSEWAKFGVPIGLIAMAVYFFSL